MLFALSLGIGALIAALIVFIGGYAEERRNDASDAGAVAGGI